MPRPKTPIAKARLTGAAQNHPERYRDRAEPQTTGKALGKPPAYLHETARKAWATFAKEVPWLTFEDRPALEAACLLRARIMDGEADELPAAFFTAYRMVLSSLGATPVDRAKVAQPRDDDDANDPFASFGRAQ